MSRDQERSRKTCLVKLIDHHVEEGTSVYLLLSLADVARSQCFFGDLASAVTRYECHNTLGIIIEMFRKNSHHRQEEKWIAAEEFFIFKIST